MRFIKHLFILGILSLTLSPACDLGTDDPVDPGDPRDKFLGGWKVNESCNRGNYIVTIKPDDSNSSQVLLENFANAGPDSDDAVGLVVSNSIIVSSQTIGEGWTVSGNGEYKQDGTISWNYSLVIGAFQEDCTAVYSKQ